VAKKRKTIGDNPLDALLSPATKKAQAPTPKTEPSRVVKERLTVHLPIDLIDRVKNAVYWTPGLTLAGLAEEAFSAHVDRLKKKSGKPFPPRRSELKGGRPMK
jgi:hypothetical protein